MKSVPAIAFDYRLSADVTAAILGVAVAAALALAASGIAWWCKVLVGIAAGIYVIAALRRERVRAPARVVWQPAGYWRVVDRDRVEHVAELRSATVRGSWVFLNLRCDGADPLRLILTPRNCDADVRRQLRVRLARSADEADAVS